VVILCSIVPLSFFLNFGHLPISDKPESWAVFGDFIGGVLNPLLSFAAFVSVLITVFMQRSQLKQNHEQLKMTREELVLSTLELKRSADAQGRQIETANIQNFETTFFNLLSRFEAQSAHLIRVYLQDEVLNDNNVPSYLELDRDARYCGFEHLRYELYNYHRYYSSEKFRGKHPKSCGSAEAFSGITNSGAHKIVLESYFMHFKFIIDFIEESELEDKRKYYRVLFSELTNGELIFVFYQILFGDDLAELKDKSEDYGLFEYLGYKGLIDESLDLREYSLSAYGNNRAIRNNMQHVHKTKSNSSKNLTAGTPAD